MTTDLDVYFKKTVRYRHRGRSLNFQVAQELFSSQDIDVGTQRLLRSLLDVPLPAAARILDLGCGYGPLGVALAAEDADRVAHLVDRDALAVAFAGQNAALNGLSNVVAYGSLGYDAVSPADFDLVVSNIPAKVGEPVIADLVHGAGQRLTSTGMMAVVVVTRLEEAVTRLLTEPAIDILLRKAWPGHTVFHYRFRAEAAGSATRLPERDRTRTAVIDLRNYLSGRADVDVRGARLSLDTVVDVPGATGSDIATEVLIEGLTALRGTHADHIVAFNPGQGYGPVAAWRLLRPRHLDLIDRDLLSLAITRHNLANHGCPSAAIDAEHRVGFSPDATARTDLVLGCLRNDEGQAVHAHLIDQATDVVVAGGHVVIAGGSTAMARIEAHIRKRKLLSVESRVGRKGHAALVLRRSARAASR